MHAIGVRLPTKFCWQTQNEDTHRKYIAEGEWLSIDADS